MSAIKVTNLTKHFGKFIAVDNINLDICNQRIVGFLGPNGAGKTTTLRMLVGLSRPTKGTIEIDNQPVIFGSSKQNTSFGYLPESPSFYGWMSGREYLQFVGSLYGVDRLNLNKKIDKCLGLVNLLSVGKKKIKTYSLGMKQRLGIAQALINQPKVLIMDEPLSALDPLGRREVLSVIEQLKNSMTILMSTHILADVDRICDDVAIINQGKLLAFSSLAELKAKYATPQIVIELLKTPKGIITDLKRQSWVKDAQISDNNIKILLNNLAEVADNRVLKYFITKKIDISNYHIAMPETEDLFIQIIGTKK